ncbi:MAG TPA: sugar ABC transporter substrate-binding protein [Stellaceae bacterium]|jgi:simple sugar transport system substrate-binding protein|nr:sugar ABC transporter substrate-binding protein [Stellaceae bacterium]
MKRDRETAGVAVAGRLPRRALIHGVAAGSVAAMIAATGRAAAAADAEPYPQHPRWKFVFVNHVTANPFFVPCQYGIQDACALLGCDYQWAGSETSDVAQMVNAMNTAIAGKADGIAVCLVDPKGFDRPVEAALAAGIPVFSYNADSRSTKRLAYIGQDLFLSGQMMGERIIKLVGSGKVAIFIATPGQLNLQPRFNGAADAIKKSGADIQLSMIATAPAANESLSKIDAYYLGNQDVKGMFGTGGGDTQNCGLISRKYNLASKGVHAGGYDMLPRSLEAVRDGFLDFVIDQQPYLQGFYTVMEMFAWKVSGGLVGPADIDTGLKFVTKDSIGPLLDTKSRYEGSAKEPQILPHTGAIAG